MQGTLWQRGSQSAAHELRGPETYISSDEAALGTVAGQVCAEKAKAPPKKVLVGSRWASAAKDVIGD